ncbi:transcriptional regulator MntR [Pseudoroseomonas rhizosphaerae]|uniref:Transcriptional regulator MntR n=1 Tax=Teichococcus rhizosphaerae TaxID=1335062 RepID=A0A2C7A6Q3_9PROT|nr:iron dependent repressor, metal binding and dimerization domain protein [Pseudoroseomonas rhizosphaerae]PHK93005.1 transcriptional regulator MntR [Pseudoroseomonas rhizosphaerae]
MQPWPASPRDDQENGPAAQGRVSAVLEGYLVTIARLIGEEGEARPTAIAARLGVSHVTAIRSIARLKALGLAHSKPYRSVFLTVEGAELAAAICTRRGMVAAMLVAMGVPPPTAGRDAARMAHGISEESMGRVAAFLRRHRARPPRGADLA